MIHMSHVIRSHVFSAGEGVVAAERHYDPMRAQLSAAAGVGGATALISLGVAPLLGLQAPALLSAESAFWSFIIAASAGVASASYNTNTCVFKVL